MVLIARQTLNNGDIWTQILANSSIRPYITQDDVPGGIAPIVDANFDTAPDQLFSRFYAWYDRVKVTPDTGLQLAYSGSKVLLEGNSLFELTPGIITLPSNSTVAVYINNQGQVTYSGNFIDVCIPLAYVSTDSATITEIVDVREQKIEQVQPVRLPQQVSPFITGEVRAFGGQTAPPGWVICNGQTLSKNLYTNLFNAIGYTYGGSENNFQVPDLRGRSVVGAGQLTGGSNYPLGSQGGQETVKLTSSQIPSHAHSVNDPGHSHEIYDRGHSHGVNDPGHSHAIYDPGHDHRLDYRRATIFSEGIGNADGGAEISQANVLRTPFISTEKRLTGISLGSTPTYISLIPTTSNVSLRANNTGISTNPTGGNGSHENRSPYLALNYIMKT